MIGKISTEDYLGAIYQLSEENKAEKGVSSVDVAKRLHITKASVSEMMRKLAGKGLVEAEKYSKIRLTEDGMKEAKKVIHNHRVIEFFLREILKCELKTVHEEAHKLEHAFSDDTIKRLDRFLGNPKISPYGQRIH